MDSAHPKPQENDADLSGLWTGMSWKKKAVLYRQLATSVGAGLDVARSAELSMQGLPSSIQRYAKESLGQGKPLSQVLAHYPALFDMFEVAMLQAGEVGGNLDGCLGKLADYAERAQRQSEEMRAQSIYPLILLHAAILIPSIPILVTKCLAAYLMMVGTALVSLYSLALLVYLLKRLAKISEGMRMALDQIADWVPVLGSLRRNMARSRFLECLAELQNAGILADQSADIASKTCGNAYFSARLGQLGKAIGGGLKVSQALQNTHMFEAQTMTLLATGEETGQLVEMLRKASIYIEENVRTQQKQMMTIIPVMVLLLIGAFVGLQIISTISGSLKDLREVMP